MQKVMTQMKRNSLVDDKTGRVDLRYNPLSVEEDYYIPVRGGTSQRFRTLPGGQYNGALKMLNIFVTSCSLLSRSQRPTLLKVKGRQKTRQHSLRKTSDLQERFKDFRGPLFQSLKRLVLFTFTHLVSVVTI